MSTSESKEVEAHYQRVSRIAGDYDPRVMEAIKAWCKKREEEVKVAA